MLTVSPEYHVILLMVGDKHGEYALESPLPELHFWCVGGDAVEPEIAESLIEKGWVTEIKHTGTYKLSDTGRKLARILIQYGFGRRR